MKRSSTEFTLNRDEPVADGVRRIACEELDHAILRLKGSLAAEDRDERVHEARKTIKRLRGLVRLVRQELGESIYRVENDCFREAAVRLAAAREAAASKEALEALLERFSAELRPNGFAATRAKLEALQLRAIEDSLDPQVVDEVVERLEEVRGRVADWPLLKDGWQAIEAGLVQTYRQGAKEYAAAREVPSVENLHEWRKRVKYHWFHVRLLRMSWNTLMTARRDALKELSDLLGDDHDLSELRLLLLNESGDPPIIDSELAQLLDLIDRRRRELVLEAYSIGARIYAERPPQLGTRLGAYFCAWRQQPEHPLSPNSLG